MIYIISNYILMLSVTLLHTYSVTVLQCCSVAVLQCYSVTVLPLPVSQPPAMSPLRGALHSLHSTLCSACTQQHCLCALTSQHGAVSQCLLPSCCVVNLPSVVAAEDQQAQQGARELGVRVSRSCVSPIMAQQPSADSVTSSQQLPSVCLVAICCSF